MQGFFSWEQDGAEDQAPYMGSVAVDPYSFAGFGALENPLNALPQEVKQAASQSIRSQVGAPPEQKQSVLNNPLVKKLLKKGANSLKDYLTRDKTAEGGFGGDGLKYNPDDWSYSGGDWHYTPKTDPYNPGNWTVDPTTGEYVPIGGGTDYTGTLIDPDNPLGLDDAAWAGVIGAGNSGSLAGEGLGLYDNISDMGGVADEIASQGGGGLMNTIGKTLPLINMIKGIYGLTQGSGGKGGADLATSALAYFIPAVGWVKAVADVGMGIGQYVRSRGRQHNWYHPYVNSRIKSKDGYDVWNVGFDDKQDRARAHKITNDGSYVPSRESYGDSDMTPSGGYNKNGTVIEKDGEYYFVTDVAKYLGLDSYDDYLRKNGMERPDEGADLAGLTGTTERGDWQKEFSRSGLMTYDEYRKYLNDNFIHKITQEGINWDSPALERAEHGMFKGYDTMGAGSGDITAKHIMRVRELYDALRKDNPYMDTSAWGEDWVSPEVPTYERPASKYGPYDEYDNYAL